jgi:hypothetical protein
MSCLLKFFKPFTLYHLNQDTILDRAAWWQTNTTSFQRGPRTSLRRC